MSRLDQARAAINAVDAQMAKLFCQRMEAVKEIADYKQEQGLPVLDRTREEEVMKRNLSAYPDPKTECFYAAFLQNLMELSRQYQQSLRDDHSDHQ